MREAEGGGRRPFSGHDSRKIGGKGEKQSRDQERDLARRAEDSSPYETDFLN